MVFIPKRVKFRKAQRGKMRGIAGGTCEVSFGEFGLKAMENAWLRNNQLEAIRIVLSRQLRRGGKTWLRVYPDKPVSKKPAETRQGKGKGETAYWVAVVKRGKVMFEIAGVPESYARQAFRLVAHKLPFKTKFVTRRGQA